MQNMQTIIGSIRKAIKEYDMIQEGDKIAIGLSGGKDSITMLMCLNEIKKFHGKNFDIVAITVNPGWETFDSKLLQKTCKKIGVEYIEVPSKIKQIVFDARKEKNPCSLCANLRRGILNSAAIENGCNKVALAHNEDDVLETFLLNLLYVGSISNFAPVSYLDRVGITVIRPLIYVSEKTIRGFIKQNSIKVMPKVCPMDGYSKREEMKNLIISFQKNIPHIRSNLYGAIKRSKINGWKEK
jgi:tRNA(Ile)-lysidine synthase TilS/MesJ